ncbi:MAG: hypothetical protein ACI8R9_000606 [Paraglaciecola sp.]|jgi:hypothetical protein
MKDPFLKASVGNIRQLAIIIISMAFSFNANATLDFTFDVYSDDWAQTKNLTDGDTLTFSFADDVDLTNFSYSDIVSHRFDYLTAGGGSILSNRPTGGWSTQDPQYWDALQWDGTNMTLNFDKAGGEGARLYGTSTDGKGNEIHPHGWNAFQFHTDTWLSIEAKNSDAVISFKAHSAPLVSSAPINAPTPSTLGILALGLLGIASRRFKKRA